MKIRAVTFAFLLLWPLRPAWAQLACSALESSEQVASINEVRTSGSNPEPSLPAEFVELYLFSNVSTSGWQLCYYDGSASCINVPTTPFPYPYSTAFNINPSSGEFILLDADGDVLDHLRYRNNGKCSAAHWSVSASCRSGCITAPASDKDLARLPDGSGSWGANDDENTAGGSNSGEPAGLDHIRVLHDGSGLTCNAETITLRACADASCSTLYTGSVSVTPTASAGIGASYTPSSVTFSGGSTSVALRATTAGTTTLGASVTSPTALNSTRCFIGATESCSMTFADSGLLLSVPDHVSDVATAFTVAAVRKSDNALACVPAFANVVRDVRFYTGYLNPASGTLQAQVDGSVSLPTSAPGATVSLSFDSNGQASANLRYPDVGEMRLSASYAGSAAVGDNGLSLVGEDAFIVRPAAFTLSLPGNPAVAAPAGGASEVFRRAGRAFDLQVTAVNASAVATPNFGQESPAEGVQFELSLLAPLGGNAPPLQAAPGLATFVAGAATGSYVWDEVGAFSLLPRLSSGSYLGSADVVGNSSGTVGRFVPDHLQLTAMTLTAEPGCPAGGFSYFGQALQWAVGSEPQLTISAHSASAGNPVTGNYEGSFWRLAGGLVGRSYYETSAEPDQLLSLDSSAASLVVTGASTPPFDGSQSWQILGDQLTAVRSSSPSAPLDAQWELRLLASDLTDLDGICYDADLDGSCDGYALAASATLPLRWGRVAVDNAFGPELFDLKVPLRAEYFDGTLFQANPLDSCSRIDAFSLTDANPSDSLLPSETCVQDSGNPGSSGLGCASAGPIARQFNPVAAAGQWNLWLKAPGAGNTGELDLQPTLPAYLQFDWTGSGAVAPQARVSFGVYAGEKPVIFQRETY